MDSTDQDNTSVAEQTTTLIYESAVIARRKRMEIRRFKRFSNLPASLRSLNSIQQGDFKRHRPIRTSSICMCYHGIDIEDDCDNFPPSKLFSEAGLPFATELAEIEVPHAYDITEGCVARGNRLVRSKSLPLDCVHTSQCIVHITKASHDHVVMNTEGHFTTVVTDKRGSIVKKTSSEVYALTTDVSSSKDPTKCMGLSGGKLLSGDKGSPPVASQQTGKVVVGLSSGKVDVEETKGIPKSSKECRFSAHESSELDVPMQDPGDGSNTTSGPREVPAPTIVTNSSALTDPQILRTCPLSGKVLVCGRRREMEDTAIIAPSFTRIPCDNNPNKVCDLHFFAVYDGHGGAQASNFCAGRLHHALAEELAGSLVHEGTEDDLEWKKVMTSCFLKVDQEVGGVVPNAACDKATSCSVSTIAPENVGTTAVVAVFSPTKIILANCGDSRAVLSRAGVAIPLTKDHKPEREDETSRIEAAGGRVIYWDGYRVSGLLAISRAIGDSYLKEYVISEPDVLCLPRTEDDECLILASDGLWDVISNETACDVARRCLASARKRSEHRRARAGKDSASAAVAALLVKLAYGRGSKDNISVVVIDLRSTPS